MRTLAKFIGLILLCAMANEAAGQVRRVVIYDGAATDLGVASPFLQSKDLWVTLEELTRVTGFVVKPQGVCRSELCFPLPKQRKADFLGQRGEVTWFNLSEFARLVKQPVAHDEKLAAWCFGPRQEEQNGYLATLEAPNFTLPDKSGKLHSLSDFRGKKVLLITWASW
jgi:AhpC/TSA family